MIAWSRFPPETGMYTPDFGTDKMTETRRHTPPPPNKPPHSHRLSVALVCLLLIGLLPLMTRAVPPTDEAIEKWVAEGVWKKKVETFNAFRMAGGNSPEEHTPLDHRRLAGSMALTDAIDTVHLLVILVDFVDHPWQNGTEGDPSLIDSVLFSEGYLNPTGSMTDFFLENSYGTFLVKGDLYGWYQAPETYAWYENGDDGMSRGRDLARHAVEIAAPDVPDFGKYDSNNDGYCDGLIIIHSGAGAETGAYGIWSHKSSIEPPLAYDGVTMSAYTMNPEEYQGGLSPIGVFCHEYGHFLGLPDLYDIDYDPPSSRGLGNWALMASGSYNGDSRVPAQLIAWCKSEVGFLNLIDVTENMHQVAIPSVEDNPVAYRLHNTVTTDSEFWVVENKQPFGYDAALPAWGLCIFHVDNNAPWPNINHLWYHVAMEQADGQNSIALGNSRGDAGDPFPGASWARAFHDLTNPSTHTNDSGITHGATTQIGVWNISNSDSIMYADFDLEWSRPYIELSNYDSLVLDDAPPGGDGDGYFEPGETIRFYCRVTNQMRTAFNAQATLTANSPHVTVTVGQAAVAATFDELDYMNSSPIEFVLADAFVPTIDSFELTISCDSTGSTAGGDAYSRSFSFEANIGPPQVLIVDDDRGRNYEEMYADVLYRQRIPYAIHSKETDGTPSGAKLSDHRIVFWHTGDSSNNVLQSGDLAAMNPYLDNDGNLLLSTISGAFDLTLLDSSFLHDYLGAVVIGAHRSFAFDGVDGNPIGDSRKFRYIAAPPVWSDNAIVTPVGGGSAALTVWNNGSVCAVTVDSSWHSLLVNLPVEYITDDFVAHGYGTKDTLLLSCIDFFGGIPMIGNPAPCCVGIRGDAADPMDGVIDITDLVYLIDFMFRGGPEPPCFEEADVNGDYADPLEITDLLYLIDYMYTGGPPPVACP